MIAKDHGLEIEWATKRLLECADDHGKGAFSRDVRREAIVIMGQLGELEKAYRTEMKAALDDVRAKILMEWEAEKARRPWNRFKRLFRKG